MWRPRLLLNTLHCPEQPPTTKKYPVPNVTSARIETPCSKCSNNTWNFPLLNLHTTFAWNNFYSSEVFFSNKCVMWLGSGWASWLHKWSCRSPQDTIIRYGCSDWKTKALQGRHAYLHMLSTFSTFGTFYGANKTHAAFSRSLKDQSVFSMETSPSSRQSKANVPSLWRDRTSCFKG